MTRPNTLQSLDTVFILRRRDLVRGCMARGMRPIEIIEFLSKKKDITFFPTTFTDKQKLAIVGQDVAQINKEAREEYVIAKEDADVAMVEYLERQAFLYTRALTDSKIDIARELSKDIARAKGVPVDEVVRVEADMTKFMRQAFAMAKDRQNLAAPRTTLAIVADLPDEVPIESQEHFDEGNKKTDSCPPPSGEYTSKD